MPTLAQLIEPLTRRVARKTVPVLIPASHVHGETLAEPPAEPGLLYFQFRLSEMYLRYDRVLWKEYTPAALFLVEFKYGQEDVRSPVFINHQILKALENSDIKFTDTRVQFSDTRIIGPMPYQGNEVALFSGLYRAKIQDWRQNLFSVFEKLFGAVNLSQFAQTLQLAGNLTDELLAMFGMGDIESMIAQRQVFATQRVPLRNAYIALLNADEDKFSAESLHVSDGRLRLQDGAGLKPFDAADYCLLRMETSETRNDFTTLPFHQHWDSARTQLLGGKLPEAKAGLVECFNAILASKDLTENHKYQLLEYYQALFLRDQARFAQLNAPPPPGGTGALRTGRDGAGVQILADRLVQQATAAAPVRGLERALGKLRTLAANGNAFPAELAADSPQQRDAAFEQGLARHLAQPISVSESGYRVGTAELAHGLALGLLRS